MSHMTGRQLIAAERQRQIESEGWTQEHDHQHGPEILELAARCYRDATGDGSTYPTCWPWSAEWWKPMSRQRNLERAGALYLAAADVAVRTGDFKRCDSLREHAESCGVLLNSIIR